MLLVGPVTWTTVSLASGANGTLPAAGPTATLAQAGGFAGSFRGGFPPGGLGGFGAPPGGAASAPPQGLAGASGAIGEQSGANRQLVAYLEAHQGSAKYLFATLSSQTAAPYIIATGKPVMTLGGFTGSDQILTLSQLQTLVRAGQVRYFLLAGGGAGFGGGGAGSSNSQLVQWIEAHATLVSVGGVQLYAISSAAGS